MSDSKLCNQLRAVCTSSSKWAEHARVSMLVLLGQRVVCHHAVAHLHRGEVGCQLEIAGAVFR